MVTQFCGRGQSAESNNHCPVYETRAPKNLDRRRRRLAAAAFAQRQFNTGVLPICGCPLAQQTADKIPTYF